MLDELPQVLRSKISPDSSGCWLWTAAKDRSGYGRVRWEDKTTFAHRTVYSVLVGDPGPELDHVCGVHACVNPAHLEPVAHSENIRRSYATGKHDNSATWPIGRLCPQGHVIAGDNMYEHYSEKLNRVNRQCKQCRRESKRRRRAAGARN